MNSPLKIRRFRLGVWLGAVCCVLLAWAGVVAQEQPNGGAAGAAGAAGEAEKPVGSQRPVRVLFLGHDSKHHNSNEYFPLLQNRLRPEGIALDYYTKPDCLTAETLSRYDAVLLYANHGRITPEQFDALYAFVAGGHGFVPVHCASACFGNDPRFRALVGGRFKSHKSGVFKTVFIDRTHPVFAGVSEYETWDETYVHDSLNTEGRTLLAERVEEEQREPWTWVRTEGKGRVFYTASGHDERTWKNNEFQKLLRNGILWSVGEAVVADWEKGGGRRLP
jgi:type 1 glutamine amidotransferase